MGVTPTQWSRAAAGLLACCVCLARPAAADAPPAEPAPKAEPAGHASRGISLGADIQLHARFDLSYERYGYSDDPGDGKNALRNYHRYVFLSRHSRDDGFTANAELLGLTFYEIGYRFDLDRESPWRVSAALGKILIPFGADPLYHHAYGGRIGADQRVLPAVWADFGLKAAVDVNLDPVRLRVDAYGVRAPGIREATKIVDLQTDLSPLDDAKIAGGARIAASWGPATLYYSVYGSSLDFGQSLLVQALDLSIYRIPGVPFLEDLALSVGVMRVDVWAGDEPDYYNFADYLEVRYYPIDCLYLQYRGGLDTRDNRAGVFADPDRLTRADTSTHSVAVGWTMAGFSLVVMHLWQLELVDEVPDDVLRVTATYEF